MNTYLIDAYIIRGLFHLSMPSYEHFVHIDYGAWLFRYWNVECATGEHLCSRPRLIFVFFRVFLITNGSIIQEGAIFRRSAWFVLNGDGFVKTLQLLGILGVVI